MVPFDHLTVSDFWLFFGLHKKSKTARRSKLDRLYHSRLIFRELWFYCYIHCYFVAISLKIFKTFFKILNN